MTAEFNAIRTCRCGCGASLDGLRADATYASEACSKRARRGFRPEPLTCGFCGRSFEARRDARWCSEACGKQAARLGRDGEAIAWAQIVLRDSCAYCSAPAAHIDHIRARSRGGENSWPNLTGACARCNSAKGSHELLSYLLRHPLGVAG